MADTSDFVFETEGKRAALDDYFALMDDRPLKLTAEQCCYSPSPRSGFSKVCDDCIHLFRSKVGKRITCEIFRPADDNNVSPAGHCAFWTDDYRTFPLLKILEE
jgi:hypothetical protein